MADNDERLALMEDRDAIQRLQNMYGFYIDNRMWGEMAELPSARCAGRWVPTFYTQMEDFDKAVFQTGPESTDFPPDAPSQPQEPALGRSFPPFHSGIPSPISKCPLQSPSLRSECGNGL
jgi:SnoaL-like domain